MTVQEAGRAHAPPGPGGTPGLLRLGALCVAIFLLAGAAVWASPEDLGVAVWWPAAGVSVLALVHVPRSRWPVTLAAILLASAVANGVVGDRPPGTAAGLAVANTAEALVVARLLTRRQVRPALQTLDDLVRLVVATLLGVLTMGLLGGLTVAATGYGDMVTTARTVMASHGAAILVIVPLGLRMLRPPGRTRRVELTVQTITLLAAIVLVFAPQQRLPLTFLPLPFLVWGALRQSPRVVAAQTVAAAVLVTTLTTFGGPFSADFGAGTTRAVVLAQSYLVMTVLVALPLSISVAMRRVRLEGVTASERLLREGFSGSLVGMLLLHRPDGPGPRSVRLTVVELNPVAARLLGAGEDELIGTELAARLSRADRDLLDEVVHGMEAGRLPSWHEEVAVRADGGARWIDLALAPLPESAGPGMYVAQVVDVTARREAEERLTAQALQDGLTGLASRTLLRDRVGLALETLATCSGDGVAVLFCDLDDFKLVNDSGGHGAGDLVLTQVARRLEGVLRPGDLAARHGGDEFVVLRPRVQGAAEAEALAAEVVEALDAPVVVGEEAFVVGTSIGVALGTPSSTPEGLLRDAEAAMYAAKTEGKRRAVLFADEHRSRAVRAVRLEVELRRALEEDELAVHLQPVVDLRTGRTVAAEALVRWHHPEQGTLGPGEWLDVAEDRGLMPELGAWVLERACRLAASWQPVDDRVPAVHVNVSARQLERADFVDVVRGALGASGLPPERLVLEFTETHLEEVSDGLLTDLARLRAAGVGLAADDFGTGYSPLTRVIELPISMIKIDRRFVLGMLSDRRSRAVVTTLVRLGESLGLEVVAEGVETPEHAAALRVVGCRTGQGYLWSRPVPGEAFAAMFVGPRPSWRTAALGQPAS